MFCFLHASSFPSDVLSRYPLDKLDEEERALGAQEADSEDSEDSEDEDMESEEEESDSEEDGDMDEDDPSEGPPKKDSSASSGGLKKSAAGLCIHVGSFSDPEDVPGRRKASNHTTRDKNKIPFWWSIKETILIYFSFEHILCYCLYN